MTPGKRALDLLAGGVGLVVGVPVFLVVAAAVKLDDGGPVFFRQERVGRHGRRFRIWKFRS
ncbi:MAG TPA: sugar transferase, partial [Longimicrobiales bacterium]